MKRRHHLLRRGPLLAVAVLALAGCSRDDARPEGIAERFLHAVSDSGRDGLRADAEDRMQEHGDPALAARLVPTDVADDERIFTDLEVGKAVAGEGGVRVPFRATARIEGDERRELTGTAVLTPTDGDWLVSDLQPRGAGETVPSEGGPRPAGANAYQWVAALLLSLALTVASVAVIEAQPRPRPAPQG